MIVLIGANGSMGKRYQAILRYLGQEFRGFDLGEDTDAIADAERVSAGVIIASPTETHEDYLRALSDIPAPILCEKPITKNLHGLCHILKRTMPLRMMNQYAILDDPDSAGLTLYNFYHHGSDTIQWDCMLLIGLARGSVALYDHSPIWTCTLNGRALSLDEVGRAYVSYVDRWLQHPDQDREEIYRMHEKAAIWRP